MSQSTDALFFYGYVWEDEDSGETYSRLAKDFDEFGSSELVCVTSHCSCEYPMLVVCVKPTLLRAWRGSSKRVGSEHVRMMTDVQRQTEWRAELDRFCREHDVDLSEAKGPDWFLVSDWG